MKHANKIIITGGIAALVAGGAFAASPAGAWDELPCGATEETAHLCAPGEVARNGTVPNPAPPPPTPTTTIVPPPPVVVPPPPPTCEDLRRLYPRAGPRFWIDQGCAVPPTPPPPRRKREVCEAPAKLRIVQPQRGTDFVGTYPLRVIIANTTGAALARPVLVIDSSRLQNFVGPQGRVNRLVIPLEGMSEGLVGRVDRRFGFVGPAAYREVFTTSARLMVGGKVCGYTLDRAFEG